MRNEREKADVTGSKRRKPSLIPKYLIQLLSEILAEKNGPIAIGDLLGVAVTARGGIPVEFAEKKLYALSTSEDSPFFVAEYPGFKLRSVSKLPDFSRVGRGLRYIANAAKVLISSREYVDVREIVRRVGEKKLYRFPTETPEYWMFVHLCEQKRFFLQRGNLTIGLKQGPDAQHGARPGNLGTPLMEDKLASAAADDSQVTRTIHEANLESVVVEHLDKIEEGLQLTERQRVCPGIGRIDILCKDKHGDLVIVELKSFWAKQDSTVDQIGRYMGYVRSYLAKPGQSVRGIILVAKADEKLRHAVAGFPNLALREFDLSIK